MSILNLLKAIEDIKENPKDSYLRMVYYREYLKAIQDNLQCNVYCSNPYDCNGGCYEY
jgi:hypothetical protein